MRPVVVATPNVRNGKPAGVVYGQKSNQVPVGRATAQPRVNVNSIYAPYATCAIPEKVALQREPNIIEAQPLQVKSSECFQFRNTSHITPSLSLDNHFLPT